MRQQKPDSWREFFIWWVCVPLIAIVIGIVAYCNPIPVIAAPSASGPPPRADARAIPWGRFTDPGMVAAKIQTKPAACGAGHVLIHRYRLDSREWVVVEALGRIVVLFDPRPDNVDADPTWVGFGMITEPATIPTIRWEPFAPHKKTDICDMMFPKALP